MWSKANRFVFLCLSRFLCLSGVLLTLVFCFPAFSYTYSVFPWFACFFCFRLLCHIFAFCVFSAQIMSQMQFGSHGVAQDTQLMQVVFSSAHRAPS